MKEYAFVKPSEGMKGIKIGNKALDDNITALIEKYAQEGWEVFQFMNTALGEMHQIIFVRDKR